jgi:hypothetical protein
VGAQHEIPGRRDDPTNPTQHQANAGTDDEEDAPPPLQPRNDDEDSDDEDDETKGTNTHEDTDDDGVGGQEIPYDEVYHPDTMTPSLQSTYGLRPRRARHYSHLHVNIMHHAMTQYSLNRGLRKFKVKGEQDVEKELEQLHLKETFAPAEVKDLTPTQKKAALKSFMFLKEKREGAIKGRACVDGRKQREGSKKSDATPPTAALESVLITATIDAHEI